MKPASAKTKGSRLERKLAALIRQKGLDKDARRMPLSGGFSHLPGDVYTNIDYHFECKNRERHDIWRYWDSIRDKRNPVLVVSGNHRPILAVIDIQLFLNLLLTEKQYLEDVK
ncbi:MAG: hypothetical protein MN733_18105 [Nitrososphaera sp.]|nr:hypothetical protein [Nitrososphaera sp.]